MNPQGWIKIHRSLLKWEWSDDPNTGWLFIICLLKANHEDGNWHGISIKKGSFISSQSHLAKISGLSVRQVRTSINKLKMTGELTVQITNKYSVVTINKWIEYQQDDRQNVTQMTGKRQADDRQVTTNNNDNNEKKDKNEEIVRRFLNFWNETYKTKYTSYEPLLTNFEYWSKQYTLEEIKEAVLNIRYDDYWKNRMTPVIMLRRKNPRGEDVDYIGELLNMSKALKVNGPTLADRLGL